ncbi:MAG: LLM class flavin-dependent oxidoreductase [Alphaproteobacteria bacterium]|nr:LLM class flavin-dependent oxidoreductase [Alphaproteobacteria bacterium]
MRMGMLHLFENPVGKSEHQIIKEQMELMYEAENLGFDSVWPAEHHFSEYGYCASPQVSLAAVAARTKRIRLGTGVVVLPFHNPIRVAEDFAFLDLMSDGRVDLGIGRGYQPLEFRGFGMGDKQAISREIFDEATSLIRACWTEERVTFKGKHYQVDNLLVRPKPLQKPHPPIYMACLSPETFQLAGRYGFNVLMSGAFGLSPEGAKKGIADYRAARKASGFDPASGQVALLLKVYVGDSMDGAMKEFAGPVTWYYRTVAKYLAPPAGEAAVKSYEMYSKSRHAAETLSFEELAASPLMVCGDVDHCVEKLTQVAREYGFNELLCWTRIGGLDNPKVLRSMELMSDRVMPRVRQQTALAA